MVGPESDVGRRLPASSARNAIVVRHWVTSTKASQTFGRSRSISCSCEGLAPLCWFSASDTRGVFIDIDSASASGIGLLSPSPFAVTAAGASAGWVP